MLDIIKLLLGISLDDDTKDDLIDMLIDNAIEEALLFTNRTILTDKLTPIVHKMVVQNYNRLGTQGVSSQSYNGVSESFLDGYTSDILKGLERNKRIVLL